jgi:hypothetical protein
VSRGPERLDDVAVDVRHVADDQIRGVPGRDDLDLADRCRQNARRCPLDGLLALGPSERDWVADVGEGQAAVGVGRLLVGGD